MPRFKHIVQELTNSDEDEDARDQARSDSHSEVAPEQQLDEATQLTVASYIEAISAELRVMARNVELDGLAYFLEMVRIEASIEIEKCVRRTQQSDDERSAYADKRLSKPPG